MRLQKVLAKPEFSVFRVIANHYYTNTFLLLSSDEALVVDPGFSRKYIEIASEIADFLKKHSVRRVHIFLTHGHLDHFSGDVRLRQELYLRGLEAEILIHGDDAYLLEDFTEHEIIRKRFIPDYSTETFPAEKHRPDITVRDSDILKVGQIELEVVHSPGHTPGSSILYSRQHKLAFTGDVVLDGGIGRVDFPHSDARKMRESLARLLEILDQDTLVLPGHGEPFRLYEQVSIILAMMTELE